MMYLNVDELFEKLVDYGFERTDFVYEPGQFALRGGILIFILLEMKSLTVLNYLAMMWTLSGSLILKRNLSERKLLQVNIIPNVETQFEKKTKFRCLNFYRRIL